MDYIVAESIQELRSPQADVREAAARRLGQRRPEAALQPLLAALHDNANEVLMTVVEALGKYGALAVPGLVEHLGSPDSSVRYAAALTLHNINSIDAESALIDGLQDDDRAVAEVCAEALQRLNTPKARAALATWHDDEGRAF